MSSVQENVWDIIRRYRVVPVIAIDSAADALPLADALLEGGLPLAEITFRTQAAAEVIRLLCEQRPEMLVGAGTVLTLDNLNAAISSGAKFGVAPGFNPNIVGAAQECGLPFVPGVCTPSEIETALDFDCPFVKFFPAGALGGPNIIKAMTAPYRHTGIQLMPTGGVKPDNLASYLEIPNVAACGGTWIATAADLQEKNWSGIAQKAQEARKIAGV